MELLEKIEEIQKRMEKEGKTIEDYEEITKLIKKIAEIFEEKREFEKAKEQLQSLKNIPLWDKEKKQWNWCMNEEGELGNSYRRSSDQLLGVLVEAVVGDPEQAKKQLQSLKNTTTLWDKKKKQWNEYMNEERMLRSSDRDSFSQLLGVLVEAFEENEEEFIKRFTKLNN